jgi:phosphate transport system protein
MSIKTRQILDKELQHLQDELLALASMVENAITESVEILKRRDMDGSRRLIAQDRLINEKRFAIEDEALVLIATQQPIATDLRVIAAMLDIAHELERIGDYAKGIAKINLLIGEEPLIKPLIDVPAMATRARAMLHEALEAFAQRDAEMARAIPDEDDDVDALYNQVYRELITHILEDPSAIEGANYLLWAAHNLERSADRVTNICERVVFTVTGEMAELDVKERDGLNLEGVR